MSVDYKRMFMDEDYFAQECLPEVRTIEPANFHKDLFRLLSDTSKQYVAIIAPRGHGKSSVSTTIVPLHRILFGQERNILIMSETEGQAKAHLDSLKYQLQENPLIKTYFPTLSFPKWTEERIVVKGTTPFGTPINCQLIVKGSKQKVRGLNYQQQRPTLIIMDDVEGEDNMSSEDVRNDFKRRIDAALLPAIDPQIGRVFMIGTIVHYDSYLNEIWTKSDTPNENVGKSGVWEYVFYRAIENYGTDKEKALWPEWMSIAKLHSKRIQLARNGREYLWFQEYQNEPTAGDSQLFKPEYFETRHNYHIKYMNGDNWLCDNTTGDPVRNCFTFLGVDPAISLGRTADHFATCVIAVDHHGKKYVMNIKLQRINSVAAQAKLISELVHNFHIRKVGIETIAYQQALATQLREDMASTGHYYMIEEFKPRDRKNERLKNLEYPISQGRLIFPPSKSDQDPIAQTIEQFKAYPRGKHDDGMDATFYADIVTQRPAKITLSNAIPNSVQKTMNYRNTVETNWKVL